MQNISPVNSNTVNIDAIDVSIGHLACESNRASQGNTARYNNLVENSVSVAEAKQKSQYLNVLNMFSLQKDKLEKSGKCGSIKKSLYFF